MTNASNRVIYTGMTADLKRRVYEHKHLLVGGFTKKYKVTKLVYYEICPSVQDAALREHQIKAGSRLKKIQLIQGINPDFKDLYETL